MPIEEDPWAMDAVNTTKRVRSELSEMTEAQVVPKWIRLPQSKDCDAKGRCWFYEPPWTFDGVPITHGTWRFNEKVALEDNHEWTHWAPHDYFPNPEL